MRRRSSRSGFGFACFAVGWAEGAALSVYGAPTWAVLATPFVAALLIPLFAGPEEVAFDA